LENCGRPAIITKDLSMVIYGRDARTGPRSLKHLFTGSYRNVEANRLSGVYELVLKRASEAGSPGRFPFEKSLTNLSVSLYHWSDQVTCPLSGFRQKRSINIYYILFSNL
jgi:hypothetical protein